MTRVLFICTHNSARSQMAEGLLRALHGDRYEAVSAGSETSRVRPEAVAVMAEAGIDIFSQRSKAIDEIDGAVDVAVTVCDDAKEACPVIPGATRILHWSLPDPSQAEGTAEERLAVFRDVRDDLRRRIEETFGGDSG